MSAQINWMARAADKVGKDLQPQFERESATLFPRAETVTVYDCFAGHTEKQHEKGRT